MKVFKIVFFLLILINCCRTQSCNSDCLTCENDSCVFCYQPLKLNKLLMCEVCNV